MPERLRLCAQEIMRRDVATLTRDPAIAEAVRLLAERGVSCAAPKGLGLRDTRR